MAIFHLGRRLIVVVFVGLLLFARFRLVFFCCDWGIRGLLAIIGVWILGSHGVWIALCLLIVGRFCGVCGYSSIVIGCYLVSSVNLPVNSFCDVNPLPTVVIVVAEFCFIVIFIYLLLGCLPVVSVFGMLSDVLDHLEAASKIEQDLNAFENDGPYLLASKRYTPFEAKSKTMIQAFTMKEKYLL
ncbi:hypothetical protein QVD17_21188 [Tagetes erecta]|uniref:Uncharacterized protein n=1 Tax=Tagetes erecta TaxID=13708 RepID=A0AAD8KMX2_TARER|nr:hypothetical protein QVD17_21188 [Tagetes erecta]